MRAAYWAFVISAVSLAAPSFAQQSSAYRGAESLGRALLERDQSAYEDQYRRTVETEAAFWEAVRARQEADALQLELQMMESLRRWWIQLGLPEEEAAAVSRSFQWNGDLDAMLVRARREGAAPTIAAAVAAYKDYRYLQANQLLVAAQITAAEAP